MILHSGDVANRHTEYGSLFVRCIVYVLSRKAHRDHLVDMLTEVGPPVVLLFVTWLIYVKICLNATYYHGINSIKKLRVPN